MDTQDAGGPYTRASEFDKRISQADDFNADAWRDREGNLTFKVPGYDPNKGERAEVRTRGRQPDGSFIF